MGSKDKLPSNDVVKNDCDQESRHTKRQVPMYTMPTTAKTEICMTQTCNEVIYPNRAFRSFLEAFRALIEVV